jgi:hypothetical protein
MAVSTSAHAVQQIIKHWPKEPQESAEPLIDYYGQPDEYSESQLIWNRTFDGWKRTVLSKEETPHNFPAHQADFLEQSIDYKVPIEMYSKLAEYDGSVMVERTRGELSTRCGGTSMNFVANLAHDIITGERDVQAAREEYAKLYQAHQKGEKPPYTTKFQFDLPTGDTRDLDRPSISE